MITTPNSLSARFPSIQNAPLKWKKPCSNEEATLHQLSPYIGKLKSSIAGELIESYTKINDLVVDPFCGAGTIPLESLLRSRRIHCSDISPYARILTLAKLNPPDSYEEAIAQAENALTEAQSLPLPDLRSVPDWVKEFFHPQTLKETLRFAHICRQPGGEFLMACFLGILHHQRPGFLSYPSSHLVPYLRDKKYPKELHPEMYEYRALRPRLLAKIKRVYKRTAEVQRSRNQSKFTHAAVQKLPLPLRFDALITSPPYMNALDYGRDNRLRLWFIDPSSKGSVDNGVTQRRESFISAMKSLSGRIDTNLAKGGHSIFIVGEEVSRSFGAHPSEVVADIINTNAPSLELKCVITDEIPDIRRTRRECRGVKTEKILIFKKIK